MVIIKAEQQNLQEMLDLQYLAYQSEAKLLGCPSIQPLTQTFHEIQQEYEKYFFLKAVNEDRKIVGSVRAYSKSDVLYIGKLMVHPKYQGQGIGTKLLLEIEREYPTKRYELFTSSKSLKNIKLYERLGYSIFREERISDEIRLVYLQKFDHKIKDTIN